MAVRGQRLPDRQPHQVRILADVPERQRQHPHQRAVAVVPLRGRTGCFRHAAAHQPVDRGAGLRPYVENRAVDRVEALMQPAPQAVREVRQIQAVIGQQAVEQDQRLRTVIAPRAGRHAHMRALEATRRRHVDLRYRRQRLRRVEFVGNPQCVAH